MVILPTYVEDPTVPFSIHILGLARRTFLLFDTTMYAKAFALLAVSAFSLSAQAAPAASSSPSKSGSASSSASATASATETPGEQTRNSYHACTS